MYLKVATMHGRLLGRKFKQFKKIFAQKMAQDPTSDNWSQELQPWAFHFGHVSQRLLLFISQILLKKRLKIPSIWDIEYLQLEIRHVLGRQPYEWSNGRMPFPFLADAWIKDKNPEFYYKIKYPRPPILERITYRLIYFFLVIVVWLKDFWVYINPYFDIGFNKKNYPGISYKLYRFIYWKQSL